MPVRTPPVARKGIQNCVTYEIFGGSFTIAAEKITVTDIYYWIAHPAFVLKSAAVSGGHIGLSHFQCY